MSVAALKLCFIFSFLVLIAAKAQPYITEEYESVISNEKLTISESSPDDIYWDSNFLKPIMENIEVIAIVTIEKDIYISQRGSILKFDGTTCKWDAAGVPTSGFIESIYHYNGKLYA